MQIIKEKIKFNSQDINLKISLGGGNRLSGYQQEIDEITEITKTDLINPVIDKEVKRFTYYNNGSTTTLKFRLTMDGVGYSYYFANNGAGFTTSEILEADIKLLNSFFIMDFYDSFDNYTQTKIFTTYLTKILEGNDLKPDYTINANTVNQFYHQNVPKSFLDKQTGSTVTGYVKFSFYNAKFGTVALFYNSNNANLKTPEKFYFATTLDLVEQTWKFSTTTPTPYQLPFSSSYSEKVNDAVDNFENNQQQPPDGNTFIDDGTYETT